MIRDVARRAGVSVGTVSRVINNNPTVAPAIRERVEAVIKELGYRPNTLARGLRSQRTHTLGLVIPDVTNPFFSELVKEIEQAAGRKGYSLILGNSGESRSAEQLYLGMLADRQVDGLIIVPGAGTKSISPPRDIAIVIVDRPLPHHPVVASDHRKGAEQAVERLIELGHRRIACIAGPQRLVVAVERYRGYKQVMQRYARPEDLENSGWVASANFDYDGGYRAAARLLATNPRPTAIFASSDQHAIGALRAARDAGLEVPSDLSIIGFDDIPLASLVTPRLSTVAQPIAAISERAVAMVLQIHAGETIMKCERFDTELKIRESCSPPRG